MKGRIGWLAVAAALAGALLLAAALARGREGGAAVRRAAAGAAAAPADAAAPVAAAAPPAEGRRAATAAQEAGPDDVPGPGGAVEPRDPGGATLHVRVLSARGGGPLADVELLLVPDGEGAALGGVTDAEGIVRFPGLAAGAAWLAAAREEDGRPWGEARVAPLAPGETRLVELRLPAPDDLVWTGRVVRRGEPVAGAEVELVDPWPDRPRVARAARTDDAGRVSFVLSSWRPWDVRASHADGGIAYVALAPRADRVQEIALWPSAELEVRARGAGGEPLAGLEARVEPSLFGLRVPGGDANATLVVLARTDAEGVARLAPLPATVPFDLEIARGDELLHREDEVEALAEGERRVLALVLAPGSVAGRIVDFAGRPVAGAEAALAPYRWDEPGERTLSEANVARARARTTTDASGGFRFDGVPLGRWLVGLVPAADAPHVPVGTVVELREGAREAWVELVAARAFAVAGRVLDEEGRAVPDAWVQLVGLELGTTRMQRTAQDGGFRFAGVPDVPLRLAVTDVEGFVEPPDRAVAAGDEDVVVVLERGARVTGVVRDAEGPASEGTELWSYRLDGACVACVEHWLFPEDGRFELRLAPGRHGLLATTADGRVAFAHVQVPSKDATLEVELLLVPGTAVRARSTPDLGTAALRAVQEEITLTYTRVGPGESCTFTAAPGPLLVVLERDGAPPVERFLDVRPGEEIELALTPGGVERRR